MADFTVVIPTYNEKENIDELVKHFLKMFDQKKLGGELLVVDDDSPDKTWELVEAWTKKDSRVKLLHRKGKKGLASAVIDGFEKAGSKILVVCDADFSHDYSIIPTMVSLIRQGEDIVIGSRFVEGGGVKGWPAYRLFISKGARLLSRVFLGVKVKDPMSGFFALKKSVFKKISGDMSPQGYKILLEIVFRSGSNKIKEVPFVFKDRELGSSKLSGKVMSEYLKMVLNLAFK
ncbi:MAG: polyprenol monophosphomannose synthase [Nanoarchaeota archaeon]|nr:polyprenol monophosphomannose synthase [Nanoarchaeota archaeon]